MTVDRMDISIILAMAVTVFLNPQNSLQQFHLMLFDPDINNDELKASLKLDPNLSAEEKSTITTMVQKYWDCFCKRGV